MLQTSKSTLTSEKIEKAVIRKAETRNQSTKFLTHLCSFILLMLWVYFGSQFFFHYYLSDNPSVFTLTSVFLNKIELLTLIVVHSHWFIFYYFQFPYIEQFKDNDLPWPWQEDKQKWLIQLKDTIIVNAINGLVIYPPLLYASLYFFTPITKPNEIPGLSTFLWHFALLAFIEDFFFYWGHRLLHTPTMYKVVHKKHHSHFNTTHLSALYTHWLEFIVVNVLPMLAGVAILHGYLHIVTLNAYIVTRFVETNEGHSGYNFPWSPFKIFPFSTDSAYHNFHHLKNIGNYGAFFTLWDTLFKTNVDFYKEGKENTNEKKELKQLPHLF